MLGKFLILAIVVLGYFWLKSWYFNLPKEERKKALWNVAIVALIAIMILAVATGRMHWAGLAFAFVLGLMKLIVQNAIRFAPFIFSVARKQNFSTPEFRTPYINAKLHFGQNVNIEGSVIDGLHAGKNLHDLTNEELIELASFYKEKCKRSYYLIMVLLQKSGTQQQQKFVDTSTLTQEEAVQILGLPENFTDEDIKLAHRKLMQKLHPDKGGNAWLASRVNLAKDILLKK